MSSKESCMIGKEKNCSDQYIIELLNSMENEGMTEKDKLVYLRKIIKYLNIKTKYYKDLGIDSSIGMFFVGTGLGNGIGDSENMPLAISLCAIRIATMLLSSIKRNTKYNNAIHNLKIEDIKSLKKKI